MAGMFLLRHLHIISSDWAMFHVLDHSSSKFELWHKTNNNSNNNTPTNKKSSAPSVLKLEIYHEF